MVHFVPFGTRMGQCLMAVGLPQRKGVQANPLKVTSNSPDSCAKLTLPRPKFVGFLDSFRYDDLALGGNSRGSSSQAQSTCSKTRYSMIHALPALMRALKAAPLSRKAAPLWRMWSCTMPRTYSASGTPDWNANAFSAATYSGGIRAHSLAPNMRGRPNAQQIHQACLARGGYTAVEKALMRPQISYRIVT